jgi:hypothetical protein
LHIDRDSFGIIQKTGYKIFTGLSQGVVKVLKDPESQKEGGTTSVASSGSALGGGKGGEDAREEPP